MIRKLRVLVLGGSGFVGRNIIEKLSQKYILSTPSHKELNLLDTQKVENYFKNNTFDVMIYCVNIGGTRKSNDDSLILSMNLQMFFNVVRCKKYFKKMIFLGSGAEYDKRKSLVRVKETGFDQSVPVDLYGLYKYICSKYIETTDNIINLRLFGLFGKYEDYSIRFISHAICRTLFELPIVINQNVYFDYLYIDDFISFLDLFIEQEMKHRFYNIGTGKPVDLLSIAKQINEVVPNAQKIIVKTSGLGKEYSSDTTRLMKEVSNFSFTPFKISLEKLYTYYKKNMKLIDRKRLE